jgi:tetratricopeptide (TPR) repeat protein
MVVVFKHTVTNLSEKKLSNRNQLKSHLEKLRDLRNTIAHLGAGKDASPDERKAAMNLSENIITILGCHEKAMILAKLDVENVVNIVYLEEADKKFKAGKYEQAIMYYIKGGSEHSAKKCKARLLAEHDRFEQAIKLYRLIPDLQRSPEDNRLILQYCIACNAIETAIQFMLETSLYSQKDIMKFIEDNDLDPAVLYTYLPGLDPAHQQHIFNHHLMPKFNQLSQNCENIINQMNSIMEIDWNV